VKAHDAPDFEENENARLHPFFYGAIADAVTQGQRPLRYKGPLDGGSVLGRKFHQLLGFSATNELSLRMSFVFVGEELPVTLNYVEHGSSQLEASRYNTGIMPILDRADSNTVPRCQYNLASSATSRAKIRRVAFGFRPFIHADPFDAHAFHYRQREGRGGGQ
jgi:hypothetical protein